MAKIEFKQNKVAETTGILRFEINDYLRSIEDKTNRNEWYRNFLQIENAITFANTVDESGKTKGECLIILDVHKSRVSPMTKVSYAEFGLSGQFTNPIIPLDILSLNVIMNFHKFIGVILEDFRYDEDVIHNCRTKIIPKEGV